ncbi:MAG: NAD(P)/FAD-dependent oxidoreductase [Bacillota bacterium]
MKLRIAELRLEVEHGQEDLIAEAAKRMRISPENIQRLWILRRAVDARRRRQIGFVYTVEVLVKEAVGRRVLRKNLPSVGLINETPPLPLARGSQPMAWPPVVVGAGPAGIFAALKLAEFGYRPVLLERGPDVRQRTRDVLNFWQTGELNLESNVQFGEGGAGTFSDGKLTTRIKDYRVGEVLARLVAAGAPEEITWLHKPHVGTDILRQVVEGLRRQLLEMGGRVQFGAKVTGLLQEKNRRVTGVIVNGTKDIPAGAVVMAIGHSARDTSRWLFAHEVAMEQKPFAIGLRIEHPQALIDQSQYGDFAGHPKLGPADYHLTYHSDQHKRNAYTFCMCPGGQVVAAASEAEGVVTNGMSKHDRASGIANSALVVNVGREDFRAGYPLAGVDFQRALEKAAFKAGGGGYKAPVQPVADFLADCKPSRAPAGLYPSYLPGTVPANLREILPKEVGEVLAEALQDFDRKVRGFAGDAAVLTGLETRTSSPLRILRDKEYCSVNTPGLYPAGEGAGYAGGIVSAAVDGLRVAEAIIRRYALPVQEAELEEGGTT